MEERLVDLLQASERFRRAIISCHTQFFPEGSTDPFGRPGRVEIGGFNCPMLYLSLFDDDQVGRYLNRRFPRRQRDRLLFRPNLIRTRVAKIIRPMRSLRFRPLLLAHAEEIPERRHFLRNPKWGPSDFGCKKSGDGHGLQRPTFVLRPSQRALRSSLTLPSFPVLLRCNRSRCARSAEMLLRSAVP